MNTRYGVAIITLTTIYALDSGYRVSVNALDARYKVAIVSLITLESDCTGITIVSLISLYTCDRRAVITLSALDTLKSGSSVIPLDTCDG